MKGQSATGYQDMVWQKAHKLVLSIYKYSEKFPIEEVYGLTLQLKRAAVSIRANVADGFKKKSKDFMPIVKGSLAECRDCLVQAKDLGYCDSTELMTELEEISKLLESYSDSNLNSDS